MTREEIKEAAKVMEAYADGAEIQYSHKGRNFWINWINISSPSFDWQTFDYRIKPEPKYRPFRTQEECWSEMHKHPDFGWVKEKASEMIYNISDISELSIVILEDINSFKEAFDIYQFKDGTPFGIKEE